MLYPHIPKNPLLSDKESAEQYKLLTLCMKENLRITFVADDPTEFDIGGAKLVLHKLNPETGTLSQLGTITVVDFDGTARDLEFFPACYQVRFYSTDDHIEGADFSDFMNALAFLVNNHPLIEPQPERYVVSRTVRQYISVEAQSAEDAVRVAQMQSDRWSYPEAECDNFNVFKIRPDGSHDNENLLAAAVSCD